MKTKLMSAAVVLLLATNTVSYWVGSHQRDLQSKKDYQAACVLHDCCRNMVDNIGLEAEEIYYEYIDNLDCDPKLVIGQEDMKRYYWCY